MAVLVDQNVCKTDDKSASIYTNQILLCSNRLELFRSPWSFTHVFKKIEATMRWNNIWKTLHFLQITAEHQDCSRKSHKKFIPKYLDKSLFQFSLRLYGHRVGYWRKKFPRTIFEEEFPGPRNTAASKIGNVVISLLWQFRYLCNPDDNNFSALSNTAVVVIFPNLCYWQRSLFMLKLGRYWSWKTPSSYLTWIHT